MNNLIKIVIIALIGGGIGYITNVLAIKLMFRPLRPINILGFEIIGLIPKRRNDIARNIGHMVDSELLDTDDIMMSVITESDKEKIIEVFKARVGNILVDKLYYLPGVFFDKVKYGIYKVIDDEAGKAIDEIKDEMVVKTKERVDIEKIVVDKIDALELEKVESLIVDIAKAELKHIEVLGFFLGAIIGVVQGLIMIALG